MGNNESNPPQLISNPELRQIKCQNPEYMQRLLYLEYYLFNLNDNNFEDTACKVLAYFDPTYSFTWTAIVFNLIFTCFHSNHGNDFKIYVNFIINLTEKIGDDLQMMERFVQFLCDTARYKQEAKYFLQMLIESDIIKPEKVLRIRTLYFSHYKTEAAIKRCAKDVPFYEQFFKSFDELKKDNWKLHKNLVHDGVNPSQIALIIRNDNIEKLQEMSTQANFDFNQKIEPSLYERCSLVNQKSVSLINYSAFFGSVKCFKFLLQNDCDTSDACKYAIAGGNFEILQLCEQYHLSFDNTIETAIEYHRNQMIKYLYENKIVICNDLSQIGFLCVIHRNYEILAYLESYGMLINDKIMNKAAIIGNLYLVKHFVEGNKIPKDILPYAAFSRNVEVVRYVLTFEEIDLNAKDIYLFRLMFSYSF